MDDLMISVNLIDFSENAENYLITTSKLNPRLDAYKKKAGISSQEERRRQRLTEQKNKRQNVVESKRNVHDTTTNVSKKNNVKIQRKSLTNPEYTDRLDRKSVV